MNLASAAYDDAVRRRPAPAHVTVVPEPPDPTILFAQMSEMDPSVRTTVAGILVGSAAVPFFFHHQIA
jgi:hypothetical protein